MLIAKKQDQSLDQDTLKKKKPISSEEITNRKKRLLDTIGIMRVAGHEMLEEDKKTYEAWARGEMSDEEVDKTMSARISAMVGRKVIL